MKTTKKIYGIALGAVTVFQFGVLGGYAQTGNYLYTTIIELSEPLARRRGSALDR